MVLLYLCKDNNGKYCGQIDGVIGEPLYILIRDRTGKFTSVRVGASRIGG